MKGIIDSTLREGEQTVGVSFSLMQKLEITKRLCDIGVEEIELGIASRYDNTPAKLIEQARGEGLSARLSLWCRCNRKDIEIAAAAKPDVVSLSIPVSDLHIEKKLAKSRAWVLARVAESISFGRELAIPFISLGLEDATRAEPDFVESVVRAAKKAGADRIRLADTVGITCPAEITGQVKRLKKSFGIEIGVHMHNDFGMATANTIAALDAGADWADCTILGLGERAGNARLEELVGYLSMQRNHDYKTTKIQFLSNIVADAASIKIQPHRPIIGGEIFACETGLHLQGLRQTPSTYEPYPPEKVKAKRKLLYGVKVGRREIKDCLGGGEGSLTDGEYNSLIAKVRDEVSSLGHPLQLEDFSALISNFNN